MFIFLRHKNVCSIDSIILAVCGELAKSPQSLIESAHFGNSLVAATRIQARDVSLVVIITTLSMD